MKPATIRARDRELVSVVVVCDTTARLFICETSASRRARVLVSSQASFSKPREGNERERYPLISSAVYKLLHGAEASLRKNGLQHIRVKRVFFYYAPPFSRFGTETVSLRNEKRGVLSEAALQAAVEDVQKRFLAAEEKGGNDSSGGPMTLAVVERGFLRIRIDGYPVTSFLSREYRDFSALLLLRALPVQLAEKLSEAAHSAFPAAHQEHRLVDSAVFNGLSGMADLPPTFDYAVILPSHAFVVSVRDGVPMRRAQFDGGHGQMLSMLSRELSVTRTVAQSYVSLYLDGKLHGQSETHFLKSLETARGQWSKLLSEAQQSLQTEFLPPGRTIVLPWGLVDGLVAGTVGESAASAPRGIEEIPPECFWALDTEDRATAGPVPALIIADALGS